MLEAKHPTQVTYTKAPLPFTGQKRRFLSSFKTVLLQHIKDGTGWTVVDAFGGSGLLAHTAIRALPDTRVIYNDFEGYTSRIKHIDDINRLRRHLFDVLMDYPRNRHLDKAAKAKVVEVISGFKGHVDVGCLCSWLLFSGNQAGSLDELFAKHMYNALRQTDYPTADGYLDGLEVTSESYTTLLPQYLDVPKALFVLDPPYVCTMQGSYKMDGYFGMVEFLRLMRLVRPPWIFFSSTRSEFLSYLDMVIEDKQPGWERFTGYKKISLQVSLNRTSSYEDNLVYKFE